MLLREHAAHAVHAKLAAIRAITDRCMWLDAPPLLQAQIFVEELASISNCFTPQACCRCMSYLESQ